MQKNGNAFVWLFVILLIVGTILFGVYWGWRTYASADQASSSLDPTMPQAQMLLSLKDMSTNQKVDGYYAIKVGNYTDYLRGTLSSESVTSVSIPAGHETTAILWGDQYYASVSNFLTTLPDVLNGIEMSVPHHGRINITSTSLDTSMIITVNTIGYYRRASLCIGRSNGIASVAIDAYNAFMSEPIPVRLRSRVDQCTSLQPTLQDNVQMINMTMQRGRLFSCDHDKITLIFVDKELPVTTSPFEFEQGTQTNFVTELDGHDVGAPDVSHEIHC